MRSTTGLQLGANGGAPVIYHRPPREPAGRVSAGVLAAEIILIAVVGLLVIGAMVLSRAVGT